MNEREAFEAHITRFFSMPGAEPFNSEKMFYRIEGGRYFKGWLQSQWEGWQARAEALEGGGREPNLTGGGAELPDGWKLVPTEPTAEWVAALEPMEVYHGVAADTIRVVLRKAPAYGVLEAGHQTKSVSVPSVLPPMSGLSGEGGEP